jgi:hypothetical protein
MHYNSGRSSQERTDINPPDAYKAMAWCRHELSLVKISPNETRDVHGIGPGQIIATNEKGRRRVLHTAIVP